MKVWRVQVRVNLEEAEIKDILPRMNYSDDVWRDMTESAVSAYGGHWWKVEVVEDDDGFLSAT